jgi:hypothetical protein
MQAVVILVVAINPPLRYGSRPVGVDPAVGPPAPVGSAASAANSARSPAGLTRELPARSDPGRTPTTSEGSAASSTTTAGGTCSACATRCGSRTFGRGRRAPPGPRMAGTAPSPRRAAPDSVPGLAAAPPAQPPPPRPIPTPRPAADLPRMSPCPAEAGTPATTRPADAPAHAPAPPAAAPTAPAPPHPTPAVPCCRPPRRPPAVQFLPEPHVRDIGRVRHTVSAVLSGQRRADGRAHRGCWRKEGHPAPATSTVSPVRRPSVAAALPPFTAMDTKSAEST